MTIQRLTFEDKGQDFLWWEVDDQTGRIVGCGPHQASVWASGRCSVDMNTVLVGERPIFHGPATEPGGRFLNYCIAEIRPAQTGGGGVASMTELTADLIAKVAGEIEAGDWSYGIASATGESLAAQLTQEHGARIRTERDPMRMSMAGVTATSTGGHVGLFSNWVHAARKKLVTP